MYYKIGSYHYSENNHSYFSRSVVTPLMLKINPSSLLFCLSPSEPSPEQNELLQLFFL